MYDINNSITQLVVSLQDCSEQLMQASEANWSLVDSLMDIIIDNEDDEEDDDDTNNQQQQQQKSKSNTNVSQRKTGLGRITRTSCTTYRYNINATI